MNNEDLERFLEEVSTSLAMRGIHQHVIVAETHDEVGYAGAMSTTTPYRLFLRLTDYIEKKIRQFTDTGSLSTKNNVGRALVLTHLLRLELEQLTGYVSDNGYISLGEKERPQQAFEQDFMGEGGFTE